MWPTFSFSFVIQFSCRWLLRKLKPQMRNSLKPSDAYLMLASRIQLSVMAPRWHKRIDSSSWLTVGFRRSTKCIVLKKAGSELSVPWHICLLNFSKAETKSESKTKLILTAPCNINHVILLTESKIVPLGQQQENFALTMFLANQCNNH